MKVIKNILVGFLVSFVGSIPLGYLNIIGFEIYSKNGLAALVHYLLGVIIIEGIVIYVTLVFANQLSQNKKLLKYIEIFSIFFMLLLAYSFYFQGNTSDGEESGLTKYIDYSTFLIGIIFSSLNFIQIPFWLGWNLYLVTGNYISLQKNIRLLYLLGTLIGTFFGMLGLILFLTLVDQKADHVSGYVISRVIPLFFLGMAVFQSFKFYKKYYTKNSG